MSKPKRSQPQRSQSQRRYTPPPPEKRRWEAALGFLGFWTALAAVWAGWNVLQPSPTVWPAVILAGLLVLDWLAWRRWRES